jgi:sulfur transfer complex TusBCD TusB component (DsrH family)
MSEFTIDLDEPEDETRVLARDPVRAPEPERRRIPVLRFLLIAFAALAVVIALAGFAYWQRVKASPQYSLALLVDAARRDDQKQIDELVDTDAVVDSFLPQIIDKAVELYGKNLPPVAVSGLNAAADKLKPAIKRRAREEVPRVIREKTDRFDRVPYWAIAIGAGWFLDITPVGDTARVTSRIENRPFELTMKKNGDVWRVVGIKDDIVARRIAEKIGQEMIAIVSKDGLNKAAEKLGVDGIDELKKKIDDLLK